MFNSIWRPLFGPVRDWPLAMLDARSVNADQDLIAADVIYPHCVGESFNVFHNSCHRWFYLSDQMPEEVHVFKSFDSSSGVAQACPHASFNLQIEREQRRRESVDMIVAMIYPELV